jgi:hypothetical protein
MYYVFVVPGFHKIHIYCVQGNSSENARKKLAIECEKNYTSLDFLNVKENSEFFVKHIEICTFKQFKEEFLILNKYINQFSIINIYLSDFPLFLQYSNQKEISPIVHDFVSDKLFDRNLLKLINQYY